MFDYIKNKAVATKDFFVDLVFSKQFGQGLLIGAGLLAVSMGISYLINGHL